MYGAGAFTLIILSAVGLELRTRSGIPRVLEGLENLVSEGMETDTIAVAIENLKGMEDFQGISLLSSDLSGAKSVLSKGLATQQNIINKVTELDNLREELVRMDEMGIIVTDLRSSINQLELQLVEEATSDSSIKYLETLQHKIVEQQAAETLEVDE